MPLEGPLTEKVTETIIVGAGISGEACARRLTEAQRPFLVISENLGGRITRSCDGVVNLGAFYVRADYQHVKLLVNRGRRIDTLTTVRHSGDGHYTFWNHRLLSNLPQVARFVNQLRRFQRHYQTLKSRCLFESQAEAIRSDPYLFELYQQPALEFIEQYSLGAIARDYLGPGLYGTTFLSLGELTAFALLLGSLPLLVPIYEFTYTPDQQADWVRTVLIDTVIRLSRYQLKYRVETKHNGSFIADHVVIAAPPDVSRRLLHLPAIKRPVRVHSFEVAGDLRRPWSRAAINLFTDDSPTCAIAQQTGGISLFCSKEAQPRFADFFTTWDIIEHRDWNPAFNLVGDALLECQQAPNLYLVGDHNICGLEDAYLTGLYAANRIVDTESRGTSPPRRTDDVLDPGSVVT